METGVIAVVALVAAAGGAVLGAVVRSIWASQTIKAANSEARRIEAEARDPPEGADPRGEGREAPPAREAEEEARARRGELAELERRLLQRDEQLDQRATCSSSATASCSIASASSTRPRGAGRAHPEQVAALERVSGMSAEDAKGMLLEAIREEAEHDAVKLARAIERTAREEAQDKARDIVLTAMQRVAADHTAEHTVSGRPPAVATR